MPGKTSKPPQPAPSEAQVAPSKVELRLYTAGTSTNSVIAIRNLKQICEQYLAGLHSIEVIDLLSNPRLAQEDQIFAVPTLVRRLPLPVRKLLGDLSNTKRVLVSLDIPEEDPSERPVQLLP